MTDDLEEFLPAVLAYAKEVLDQTPEMLPVLKEAGVVDSGWHRDFWKCYMAPMMHFLAKRSITVRSKQVQEQR